MYARTNVSMSDTIMVRSYILSDEERKIAITYLGTGKKLRFQTHKPRFILNKKR